MEKVKKKNQQRNNRYVEEPNGTFRNESFHNQGKQTNNKNNTGWAQGQKRKYREKDQWSFR